MRNLRLHTVLLLLLVSFKLKAQVTTDPTLTAAITAQAVIDNNNHDKTRKAFNSIKTAQEAITIATAKITDLHNKFYKGLQEVNSNITNAFQVVEVGKIIYNIADYQVKMVQASQPNPLALAFVTKIENQLVQRAIGLEVILQQIVLKAKDPKVLLNAGERVALMNDLLLELRVIEAFSASAYYKVQLVVRQGIIRSLNPFSQMYNDDAQIVGQILQRINL